MCTVLLPPGVNPTAVNKYIVSSQAVFWNTLVYVQLLYLSHCVYTIIRGGPKVGIQYIVYRFWCISHWTRCIKLVSDAINCQACWWGSIKRFYPCCAYQLGIFSFPILLQNPFSLFYIKFPAIIHNTCKEKNYCIPTFGLPCIFYSCLYLS